jgi:nucleoside-diphosphate-sugar epimerase
VVFFVRYVDHSVRNINFSFDFGTMRVAILGAHGFVGKRLSHQLRFLGHEVSGYVLNPLNKCHTKCDCYSVDNLINSPLDLSMKYDVAINLAARRSTRSQKYTDEEVDKFTFKIPRDFFLRTSGSETLIINSSTYIQNYRGMVGNSVDMYGASKQRLSQFLENHSKRVSNRTLDLFFFTLYGIGDRRSHLVPLLLNAAQSGQRLALSPGHQLINLMYIDDAVSNIVETINSSRNLGYEKYYLWPDEYFSIRELVERIEAEIGREILCDWGATSYFGHEMMEMWPIPMLQSPSFFTTISLEQGIRKIWKSMS